MRQGKSDLGIVQMTFALVLAIPLAAMAEGPTSQPVNKSGYSLLNPTPPDQMRDMDTDRPDKTNTPHTIDAGHLQIETGIFDDTYNRDRYHGDNAITNDLLAAQFNFRLGVLNTLELNAVINSYDYSFSKDYIGGDTVRQGGFGDTVVGGKLNLWGDDSGDVPGATGLAIQPQLKVPTAREDLGNGHPELFVLVPFSLNLTRGTQLNFQTAPSWERSTDNSSYVTGSADSVEIDHSFTDDFDMFVEYWIHVTTERHQEAQQTLDVGAEYALSDNLVLDTAVDLGLNRASPSVEWVAGVSVRF